MSGKWYIILVTGQEFLDLSYVTYKILLVAFNHLVSSHGRSE